MSAIKKIWIGMLLVFLNFNLDIGTSRIGLIPDFIGYIYMLNGTAELAEFSDRFSGVRPYVIFMIIYSGMIYIMDLLGITALLGLPVVFSLGLLSTVLSLVISYHIIMGIKDIESAAMRYLNTDKLYAAWKMLAVLSIVVYFTLFIPGLALLGILAAFIVQIYYLYVFNQTKKLFYG